MLEAPFFTPRALAHHASAVQRMVDEALDSIIAKGGGELVQDLVMRVPAKTVLHVVGVPEEQWADFAIPAHAASRVPDDSPDLPREELSAISDRLVRLIRQRRAAPKEDMATAMAHARIDGEPLPDEVGAGLLYTLAIGGFDTATSLLCNALIWLGDHREAWPMLLESHESLENGINELLRVFPPNVGTLRNVTRDVEVCGQMLRKGERVMMSWGGGNYDPRKFESPFEIRLDRKNAADHLSFGWGGHRCLGAPLARLEARTILGGVLRRIPNYRILKDEVSRFETIGKVIGFNEVPFVLD